jgi:hypothetical protein
LDQHLQQLVLNRLAADEELEEAVYELGPTAGELEHRIDTVRRLVGRLERIA